MSFEGFFKPKTILMGFMHMIVAFTSIVVITGALGFNLPLAFLFAGVGTLVFHLVTKNEIPVTLGVSGVYMGAILFVVEQYGVAFAHGGIVVAGLFYILFALIMFKWQDKLLPLFPTWLLSTVVALIGLNLLPIGASLLTTDILVGLISLVVTALVSLIGNEKLGMFAVPIGVLAGTLVAFFTTGLTIPSSVGIEYIAPQFNWQSALTIGVMAFPAMFEMMGDTKNTGNIIGKNIFKTVGLGRISLGNGLASMIGGLGGSNAYTTYGENASFVMMSRFYNPSAQIWTGIFLIILAFFSPLMTIISAIPIEAFGGAVTVLFAMIVTNAIKQIGESVDLNKNTKAFTIITVMIAVSMLTVSFSGITVSSVAVATAVGVFLNAIFNRKSIDKHNK